MADFCMGCSIEIWGKDHKDLANLIEPSLVKVGFGSVQICEGCGPVVVDHNGKVMKKLGTKENEDASGT